MKKIISGQIMMWTNLIGVVMGFYLFQYSGIHNEYIQGLLGFLGATGSSFNLFISIALQIRGYRDSKLIDFTLD